MQKALQKIFVYWGCELKLKNGTGETPFRGFLQHSQSKSWQNMQKEFSPLGEIPRGQYTLIAPPELAAQVGDTLARGKKRYVLQRVETMMYENEPLYIWGLCVEKGGEDSWAMQS